MSLVVKRYIPLVITFIMGFIMVIAAFFFLPDTPEADATNLLTACVDVIIPTAAVIGLISLVRHHGRNIMKRGRFWQYSIFTIIGVILYGIVGIYAVAVHPSHLMLDQELFSYVYNNIYVHMDMTIFSLLAFFIASAAYRAFRLRTLEASVLLIVGTLMLLGRAPIGGAMWSGFPDIATWLMDVPNVAGQRAIMLGVAIGAISLCLRQLLGIERGYMGPER
jgi:hypothetical protein